MQIFVRLPTNTTITLSVHSSDSIGYIKTKIEDKTNINHKAQRLSYGLKELNDGFILSDYNIVKESTIHLA